MCEQGLDWDYEPGVFGGDVGDQEVDLVGGVGEALAFSSSPGIQRVAAMDQLTRGLYLDLKELWP